MVITLLCRKMKGKDRLIGLKYGRWLIKKRMADTLPTKWKH
jgi:predicted choloylglycine hydrolase